MSGAAHEGLLRCGGVAAVDAAHELVEGVGEAGFVLLGVTVVAVNGLGADVLPGAFVEGPVDVVAVDPRNLGEFTVGEADPDLAHVVGVVVDFPFPAAAGDGGGLAAVRGEEVRVVVRWWMVRPAGVMACQRTGSSSR